VIAGDLKEYYPEAESRALADMSVKCLSWEIIQHQNKESNCSDFGNNNFQEGCSKQVSQFLSSSIRIEPGKTSTMTDVIPGKHSILCPLIKI